MMAERREMACAVSAVTTIERYSDIRAGRHVGHFGGCLIGSVFQPIFNLGQRQTVGFEALLRAHDDLGRRVPPQDLFQSSSEPDCILLDRLCRAVHVRNFLADAAAGLLFLNVNPHVSIRGRRYGAFFRDMLERYGLAPGRVVIEIIEGAVQDEAVLAGAVDYYKEIGCQVAIDDFGAGHSNFDRIWRIRPDIVKLDKSLIAQAVDNPLARRLLPKLVGLIRESGSLALIEGVETAEQARIALAAGFDLGQGYYFARPAERAGVEGDCRAPG